MKSYYRGHLLEASRRPEDKRVVFRITNLRDGTILDEGSKESYYQVRHVLKDCKAAVDVHRDALGLAAVAAPTTDQEEQ